MVKDEAIRKIEQKKVFIDSLSTELKEVLPKVSIENLNATDRGGANVRAKAIMKMLRRATMDLDILLRNWYVMEEQKMKLKANVKQKKMKEFIDKWGNQYEEV